MSVNYEYLDVTGGEEDDATIIHRGTKFYRQDSSPAIQRGARRIGGERRVLDEENCEVMHGCFNSDYYRSFRCCIQCSRRYQ